jgi:hypothetical protein
MTLPKVKLTQMFDKLCRHGALDLDQAAPSALDGPSGRSFFVSHILLAPSSIDALNMCLVRLGVGNPFSLFAVGTASCSR